MAAPSLAYGTFVLSLASLYNRILGFTYQVVLVRLIHAEGIGLYNMVYPIYVMILVLASAGIPVAIAKLVAEELARHNPAAAYRIFRRSCGYILFFTASCTLGLLAATPWILRHVFVNPDVQPAFTALIPGILIVSVCSAFRGFFQGLQQMWPTALTQAVEQTVRVVVGLGLAWFLLPRGVAWATAGVSAGVVVGELVGFVAMIGIYLRRRPRFVLPIKPEGSFFTDTRRIFNLAVPVTLARFTSTALMSVDAILIPQRLATAGLTLGEATATYGKLVGMAETLLYTPGILTVSLATALVPAVADAAAQGNEYLLTKRISAALRVAILIGLPAGVIFLLLPTRLCALLFGYPDAGTILATLAVGGPFLYLIQTTTGILQGLGKAVEPLKNMLWASVFKVTGIYYATAVWGIQGTGLVLTGYLIITAVLNLRDVTRLTGCRLDWSRLLMRPLAASLALALVLSGLAGSGGMGAAGTLVALAGGLAVYVGVLILVGGLAPAELDRLRVLLRQVTHALRR